MPARTRPTIPAAGSSASSWSSDSTAASSARRRSARTGVDKRIDVIATAINAGLRVQDLTDLELAYAPPFGSAKDPVNVAGYVASNVLSGFQEIIDWRELRDVLKSAPASIQLVDVRTPEEFSIQTLPGARNIELDHLRDRLGELDPNRPVVIFCQVGLRGYLAYRILKQAGFADVRNLTGGFKTYAWATEKQANPDLFDYESIKRRAPAEIEAERGGCNVAVAGDVHKLDAVGLQCPGPIMKAFKAMAAMEVGETLEIAASDPAFGRDIRAWASRTGHELLSVGSSKGVITARLRKASPPAAAAASGAAPARDGVTLVVFSGDLDKAMASLIIANGALAMGSKVTLFFTFWGLNLLRNPNAATPTKPLIDAAFGFMLPKGVGRANRLSNMNFLGAGGRLMRKVMRDKHVDDPADLLAALVSGGAALVACQMSMDVMGLSREELIDGVEIGGVATFLDRPGNRRRRCSSERALREDESDRSRAGVARALVPFSQAAAPRLWAPRQSLAFPSGARPVALETVDDAVNLGEAGLGEKVGRHRAAPAGPTDHHDDVSLGQALGGELAFDLRDEIGIRSGLAVDAGQHEQRRVGVDGRRDARRRQFLRRPDVDEQAAPLSLGEERRNLFRGQVKAQRRPLRFGNGGSVCGEARRRQRQQGDREGGDAQRVRHDRILARALSGRSASSSSCAECIRAAC